MKSDIWLAYLCFLGLPAAAILLIAFFGYQGALITGSSPFVGVVLALLFGGVFLGAMIASSGTDMMDFAISSILVIVLTLVMVPVFMRARQKSHQRSVQKALRQHARSLRPQTPKSAPQH
jgi:FtsH-binding integral membrane protein